jgi:hypothetical protein
MPIGLPVAFVLLAQAAAAPSAAPAAPSYGPTAAAPPKPPTSPDPQRECVNQNKDPNGNEIVVCAIKPEGYRLPPDIVEARRLKKEGVAGPPRNPHESYADHPCGSWGCRGVPTIDMLAVAATAAQIGQRLAKGQEIGSIFETEKSSTDYQLYQMAKKAREEKEAAAAAKAVKDKAIAAQRAATANSTTSSSNAAPASSKTE